MGFFWLLHLVLEPQNAKAKFCFKFSFVWCIHLVWVHYNNHRFESWDYLVLILFATKWNNTKYPVFTWWNWAKINFVLWSNLSDEVLNCDRQIDRTTDVGDSWNNNLDLYYNAFFIFFIKLWCLGVRLIDLFGLRWNFDCWCVRGRRQFLQKSELLQQFRTFLQHLKSSFSAGKYRQLLLSMMSSIWLSILTCFFKDFYNNHNFVVQKTFLLSFSFLIQRIDKIQFFDEWYTNDNPHISYHRQWDITVQYAPRKHLKMFKIKTNDSWN